MAAGGRQRRDYDMTSQNNLTVHAFTCEQSELELPKLIKHLIHNLKQYLFIIKHFLIISLQLTLLLLI